MKDHNQLLSLALRAAVEAGREVLAVYAREFSVEEKEDRSPLTEADTRSHDKIEAILEAGSPDIPILSEEGATIPYEERKDWQLFWMIDPLDGTKEFIKKNGEFTINIALIENGVPVAGCVYAPALETIYIGGETALAGPARPGQVLSELDLATITVRTPPAGGKTAVMSRSHADETTKTFAQSQGVSETIAAGSSLKFCKVAEGAADLYPRFAPTMEWDTAAGHAVLTAAGGWVTHPDGSPFTYAKTDAGYKNTAFIAWGYEPVLS